MGYKVTVIGGANADIAGTPSCVLNMHDSNPGSVFITAGGVGRNIAENLRNFGCDVSLISAFGNDIAGSLLVENCKSLGIDISMSKIFDDARTSLYVYINDETGDMHTAVNDMQITEKISPEFLSSCIDFINSGDACVIDANIPVESIEYICDNVSVPVFADPVSVAKCMKLKSVLSKLTAIKPNRAEFAAYGEVPCLCYISMGQDGMLVIDGDNRLSVKAPDISVVNTNGCGDTAMAAIVYGTLEGLDIKSVAEFAVKSASERAAGLI